MDNQNLAVVLFKWILEILAVYRLAHAISLETGPFACFEIVRDWTSKRFGYGHWIAEFFRCPLCQSFWLSMFLTLLVFWGMSIPEIIVLWFSGSGVVMLIHLILYRA